MLSGGRRVVHDEALTRRGSRASAIARVPIGFALAALLLRARAGSLALLTAGTAAGSTAIHRTAPDRISFR